MCCLNYARVESQKCPNRLVRVSVPFRRREQTKAAGRARRRCERAQAVTRYELNPLRERLYGGREICGRHPEHNPERQAGEYENNFTWKLI